MEHAASSSVSQDEIEEVIRRFEEAWKGLPRPQLSAYLPAGSGHTQLLLELVHIELEYRLESGEPARVEEYLDRYPELTVENAVVLDLIAAEHEVRRRHEHELALGEYLDRFPEFHPELLRRIDRATIDGSAGPGPKHWLDETFPDVAGYKVLKLLGRGGMGVVYEARQLGLDRTVALKMILAGFLAGPKEVARFRAEAAALARLQHLNIVQIYEVGETAGRPYFAFEFVAGGSLAQYLRGRPQPVRSAARFVGILARAVHAAHLNGVIHRDLKPANILLKHQPDEARSQSRDLWQSQWCLDQIVPKIIDFGLAKCEHGDGEASDDHGPTVTGDLVGTPNYMAPEQAMWPRQPVGPAADVYSLGAILYELLTGRPPFIGETPLATVLQVLDNEPLSLTTLQPGVPRDLETICRKCLRKEPRQRYDTALELAEDLQRFLDDEPIRARPVSAVEKVWRWVRRHPAPAGLLAAALLAPVVALITLSLLSARLVRSIALESAAQQAELLEEATKEYSRNVRRVEQANFNVNKTVPPSPGTVPLSIPATFLHDVGEQLGLIGRTGVKIRQYSDAPFPWRKDGGPRDEFEREALRRLRQSKGHETVHEFTELAGKPFVRYAQARIMEQSCVECHSTHPQSPRKDWRVGDVRGVLEIIRPLDKDQARVGRALRLALLVSVVVSGLLLAGSMLVVWADRRRTRVRS
jgi:serine/threonine protein kinase